jgi:hypothetical protein
MPLASSIRRSNTETEAMVTSGTRGETGIVPRWLEEEIRNRRGCRPFADLLDWSGERRRIAAKHLRRGDHD